MSRLILTRNGKQSVVEGNEQYLLNIVFALFITQFPHRVVEILNHPPFTADGLHNLIEVEKRSDDFDFEILPD